MLKILIKIFIFGEIILIFKKKIKIFFDLHEKLFLLLFNILFFLYLDMYK